MLEQPGIGERDEALFQTFAEARNFEIEQLGIGQRERPVVGVVSTSLRRSPEPVNAGVWSPISLTLNLIPSSFTSMPM